MIGEGAPSNNTPSSTDDNNNDLTNTIDNNNNTNNTNDNDPSVMDDEGVKSGNGPLSHEDLVEIFRDNVALSYPYRRSLHAMLHHHILVYVALRDWLREVETVSTGSKHEAIIQPLRSDIEQVGRFLLVYSNSIMSFQVIAQGKIKEYK